LTDRAESLFGLQIHDCIRPGIPIHLIPRYRYRMDRGSVAPGYPQPLSTLGMNYKSVVCSAHRPAWCLCGVAARRPPPPAGSGPNCIDF
jgi:hypothetical protein